MAWVKSKITPTASSSRLEYRFAPSRPELAYSRIFGISFSKMSRNCVEMPKVNSTRTAMSIEEVQQLLASVEEDWYRIYLQFLLHTGCRRNEILYLTSKDIDTQRWVLRIRADKTHRTLELPVNQALQKVIEGMDIDSGYVFESAERRGQPWNEDWVTHKFKRVLRCAGLSEDYSLHSLRHTYTTHLREKGVPRDITQTLLGHTSPDTTTIYDHPDALYFRQFADMVDFESGEETRVKYSRW